MAQTEFKVGTPNKGKIEWLCLVSIVLFLLIQMNLTLDIPIFCTVYFLFFGVVTFGILLFCVKVKESTIKVRTRLGRQYEFSCSDIERVICSKRNSVKVGHLYYINIVTKSHEVSMVCGMEGFKAMAGYLLEKHENGEIKYTAVSESCKKSLCKYKNGEPFEIKKGDSKGRRKKK